MTLRETDPLTHYRGPAMPKLGQGRRGWWLEGIALALTLTYLPTVRSDPEPRRLRSPAEDKGCTAIHWG